MKEKKRIFTPVVLLTINAIGMNAPYAATIVNCETTGIDKRDFFCGQGINTSGSVKSVAIGTDVFIPKIVVPGKDGIGQVVAIGSNIQATGDNSIVIGNDAISGKTGSIALGGDDAAGTYNANGKGYRLGRIGTNLYSNNLGHYRANAAFGDGAISLGANSQALADGAISIGAAATSGTGTQSGTVWNSTSGKQSIALGVESSALKDNSMALGYRTQAIGISSIAVGNNAAAINSNATALGTNAQASGENSVAIGNSSKATAINTISIGTGNIVSGNNSVAIGDPSTVSGENTYSLGNNNTVSANHAFVLGNAVNNSVDNSVVLGNYSTVTPPVATPEYTVNGTSYKLAGSTPVSTVSIGGIGKERTLTNVASGRVLATSTDAVNGSQLFAITSEVEKGNHFAGNSGGFNRRLGETIIISGGLPDEAAASNKNIRTVASNGQIDIQLADNLDVASVQAGNSLLNNDGLHITNGPSVTTDGINAGNRIISNVGDAVSETDAVNKRQLDSLSSTVNRGWNIQANGGDAEAVTSGDTVNINGGDNIEVTRNGKTLNIATSRKASFDNVTVGNLTLDKDTGKISGLSNGTLSADSKDAVTGSQLFNTNKNVTSNTNNIATNTALLNSGLNF
ncbi:TPA: hypothetical protein JDI90_003060, partial [Salmonella enterica subsp. indica]|nr:hypothetical protein [Salmonella enterica subsp. indica]